MNKVYLLGFPQTYGFLIVSPIFFTDLAKAREARDSGRKFGLNNLEIYESSLTEDTNWNDPIRDRVKIVE